MRWLLLNTDYETFLTQLYAGTRLAQASYDAQMTARNGTYFGVADAYSAALNSSGHVAMDVHANNRHMQRSWALERGALPTGADARTWKIRWRRGLVPWLHREVATDWLMEILALQVEDFRPDVLYVQDITWATPEALRRVAGPAVRLVGQHAAPPFPDRDYSSYDLIISSWPPTLARLRSQGILCAHVALGFDPRVLAHLDKPTSQVPVSFVGGLGSLHGERVDLLAAVCDAIPGAEVYGPDITDLPTRSSVRRCYRGPAFGLDMFRVLARSRVTLNHHGFPEPHANNMRLFEATGVGALLLTDARPDLEDLFVPGQEVLTYESEDHCVATLRSLTDADRTRIAHAGQQRTLRSHTWAQRVAQIVEAVEALDTSPTLG